MAKRTTKDTEDAARETPAQPPSDMRMPWRLRGQANNCVVDRDGAPVALLLEGAEHLADVVVSSPSLLEQIRALTLYGWRVSRVMIPEGRTTKVEGWIWEETDGTRHPVPGPWALPPPWPVAASRRISQLDGQP